MNENSNEEKVVETVETTEEPIGVIPNETASAENQNNKKDDFLKKIIPIIKSKAFIICSAIVIYTIIVASVTVKIDRAILANQIQKSFQEAFSFDDSSEPKTENKVSKKENKPTKKTTSIALDQTVIQEDVYEVTVIGYDFGKKIMPSNPPSYYTYYEAKEEGHQYLDLKLNYKNLEATGIDADTVASAKLKYAGKYEYTSFSVIEDSDGDFTYSNITDISPLTVGKMHYLFDIPDEVADGTEPLVATITVKGNTYEFVIR